MNRYPVYIISKGRFDCCHTANFFIQDGVDFRIAVEPQEEQQYREKYGDRVLVLPFSNLGKGSTPARNFCWEHSKKLGAKRHWLFDDNIRMIRRLHLGKRIRANAKIAMQVIEDFTDRYENIGISGFNYTMFVPNTTQVPYYQNCHVYSALLLNNEMPYRWRLRYNEDTDLCLQVLTNKLCTISFNAFSVDKLKTMTVKGGNTSELYKGSGRLTMARALQEVWPEYVDVKWRFGRPQHVIKQNWKQFDHPLIRRKDIDWSAIEGKKYAIKLNQKSEIKSERLKKMHSEYNKS